MFQRWTNNFLILAQHQRPDLGEDVLVGDHPRFQHIDEDNVGIRFGQVLKYLAVIDGVHSILLVRSAGQHHPDFQQ